MISSTSKNPDLLAPLTPSPGTPGEGRGEGLGKKLPHCRLAHASTFSYPKNFFRKIPGFLKNRYKTLIPFGTQASSEHSKAVEDAKQLKLRYFYFPLLHAGVRKSAASTARSPRRRIPLQFTPSFFKASALALSLIPVLSGLFRNRSTSCSSASPSRYQPIMFRIALFGFLPLIS